MTPCDDKRLLLNALIDGELDAANAIALEQHLKTCTGCAQALVELQAVREAMASPGLAYAAPEAFRRRMMIALDAEARPQSKAGRAPTTAGRWTGWLAPTGLAGLTASLMVIVAMQQAGAPLVDELVSDHVRSLQVGHLLDVETSNRHVVKPWFDGKVAFAPTVVDFADKGFPLAGGRLDYVNNRAAAALVYRRRLHVINVFVWPTSSPVDRVAVDRMRDGYALLHWSAGGLNYWAVSDLDATELKQFRDLYVAALKS